MQLQEQLQRAFAPYEMFVSTSDLRHATLYPCGPNDGLTPQLIEQVIGDAPFSKVMYPSWHAEVFYGRLEDDYRAFTEAALAIMDCIRRNWKDSFQKSMAGQAHWAPTVWLNFLYGLSEQSNDPLLEVTRGRLCFLKSGVILEGGGPEIRLAEDDPRWAAARRIAEDDRHRFIKSRRNVFLLTRYAIDAASDNPVQALANVIDVTTAASRLGRSERTIRQWCEDGKPPCHKAVQIGGKWAIPDSDIPAD